MLPTSPKHVKTFEKNAIWRTLGKALGKAVRRRATKKFPGLSKDFGKKVPWGNRKYTHLGKSITPRGAKGTSVGALGSTGPIVAPKKMDRATLERFKKDMRRTKGYRQPKNPELGPWQTKPNPTKPFKNPLLPNKELLGPSDKFKNLWKPKK